MCRTLVALIAAASLSIVASGCADQKLKAKGRLLVKGQPLVLKEGESVNVIFVPILPDGKPPRDHYWAIYNPEDATFWAAGKDKEGLPPGKYRIAVAHRHDKQDLLKGQFDENHSRFVFDIDSNSQEISIDLADQSRR